MLSVNSIFNVSTWISSHVKVNLWPLGRDGLGESYSCFTTVYCILYWASLVAQTIKNLPAMQEIQVQFLGWKDSLEKGMATHSSILAWRIPWAEEPGGPQSMGSQRVKHDWVNNTFYCCHKKLPKAKWFKPMLSYDLTAVQVWRLTWISLG